MADPYWRYGAPLPAVEGSVPTPSFPGYLSSEASALTSHYTQNPNDLPGNSSDFLQKDILASRSGHYGLDGIGSTRPDTRISGYTSAASIKGYASSIEDPRFVGQRRDVTPGIGPGIPDMIYERPSSLRRADGPQAALPESNILFVDGLPSDCSRREVGHLFRPFIGFRDLKVVHKMPRRSGDKAMVLCFVEFTDAKCALTAMEALQGYKFDDKKPDSPVLKIHYAHFPFRLPSSQDEQRVGSLR